MPLQELNIAQNYAGQTRFTMAGMSITGLLSRVSGGDRSAFDHLMPLVYDELHRIAEAYLRREMQNRTLQPTALIHEAYLRMVQYGHAEYENRSHFFGVAARVMRQILVDHARARQSAKRGADLKVSFHPGLDVAPEQDHVMIALDDALNALALKDERKARMVELRFFAGMTGLEIAECMGMPVHIVRRELRMAQAWLRREVEA
ncbi:MAG TPA: sigma-70 family RNA polymerase sigma factor [Candidatus Solibacter sp.]|jgi:RNA polymerase sigma factor (TIGR02999 family)|nr:sigma-70 family RNA polymerase sigma factor [Candidatus Solibacter sp.]